MSKSIILLLVLAVVAAGAFLVLGKKPTTETVSADPSVEILTFNIEPQKRPCVGVGPMECMVVNGELFYDHIEGFEFEPGFAYVLKVERTVRDSPPADASSYVYRLLDLVSKTPVSEETTTVTPKLRYSPKGTQWALEGGSITFDDDNRYSASFGCNTINGAYTVDRTVLSFGPPMTTRMACPPEIAQKEHDFAATIVLMTQFAEDENGGAVLSGGGAQILLLPL